MVHHRPARIAALASLLSLCSLVVSASTGTCEAGEECPSDFDSLLQMGLRVERQVSSPADLRPHEYYRQVLRNSGDTEYTGELTLGGERLSGVLDTGSFEILVFAKNCGTCGTAAKYDFHKSSTFEDGKLVTVHSFGSGTCGCTDGSDVLAIGPFVVPRQDFWQVVKAQMPVLEEADFNGIIGLSPPGEPQLTNMDLLSGDAEDRMVGDIILKKNDSLVKNLGVRYFSACLQWAAGAPGYIVWNDVAPKDQHVHFREIKVSSSIYWKAHLSGPHLRVPEFREGDKSISLGCPHGCEALLDTGTSLIAVPEATFDVIFRELTKLDRDCSRLGEMPDLVFSLGGHNYSLPPHSYIGIVEGTIPDGMRAQRPSRVDIVECQLLLMTLGEDQWILGMPFFRYYYTTFDLGEHPYDPAGRRMWTAPASPECHPSDDGSHDRVLNLSKRQGPWRVDGAKLRPPRKASRGQQRVDPLGRNDFERSKPSVYGSASEAVRSGVRLRRAREG